MIFILALMGTFSAFAAKLPDSQELSQQLGIQQQDLAKLNQGEVVFFNVAEGDEKELAAGAAMYFPAATVQSLHILTLRLEVWVSTHPTVRGQA